MRPAAFLSRFNSARDGVAGIEFAMIFPVLLVLMLAGGQVVQYIDATRKIEQIAASASEMISQATPPSNATTIATVNAVDLNFAYDSSLVIFPYVMTDAAQRNLAWRKTLTMSFAGISFNKTSSACDSAADKSPCYTAHVDWTSTGTSAAKYRPCTPAQKAMNDTADYNRMMLPRSVFGPDSIIAVDIQYTFNPTFGSGLVDAVTINRSVFVQPRYATKINFDATANDGIASTCT